jgi:hypothetical protein
MTDTLEFNLTGSLPAGVPGNIAAMEDVFEARQNEKIPANEQGAVAIEGVPDGRTLEVEKVVCITSSGEALPTGVNMELVEFDNSGSYTTEETLVTGDGGTVHDRVVRSPLASRENASGSLVTMGVVVENTTNSAVTVYSAVEGEITT